MTQKQFKVWFKLLLKEISYKKLSKYQIEKLSECGVLDKNNYKPQDFGAFTKNTIDYLIYRNRHGKVLILSLKNYSIKSIVNTILFL